MVGRPMQVADSATRYELNKHAEALADVQTRPIVDGYLVRDVELTTSRTVLKHRLKRLAHYHVVRRNAAAHVYDEPADDSSQELWLRASAPVTVTLWIF